MPVQPVLSLRNVSFTYFSKGSSYTALRDVSFDVRPGEFLAIIGTSGSGKTTLLNLIGLLASPSSGELVLSGKSAGHISEEHAARLRNSSLGFVFQHFHLLPKLTALENVLLAIDYLPGALSRREEFEARAISLLKKFGIESEAHKLPSRLSGGQKQRVAICRALLLNPDILLADEPTGALDSKNAESMLQILEDLHAEGHTIVLITHDKKVAARASRVIRLQDGRVLEDLTQKPTINKELHALSFNNDATHRFKDVFARVSADIGLALGSLFTNKTRSIFTMIGLTIGVFSINIMISLSQETTRIFKNVFDTAGARQAYIGFDWRQADKLGMSHGKGLSIERDIPKISQYFSKYGSVEGRVEANGCLVLSKLHNEKLDVNGVNSFDSLKRNDVQLERGRLIKPNEYEDGVRVVYLGSDAVEKLFPQTDPNYIDNSNYPLGEYVKVTGCSISGAFVVVGILKPRETIFGSNDNEALYVPSSALLKSGARAYTFNLIVTPHENVSPTWLGDSVKNYITLLTRQRYPLRSFAPEQQVERITMMIRIFQGLTSVVGLLCTIIGGIGVMNILLVTIVERIREIGLRKALGAKNSQIRNQVLLESVILCSSGGIAGIFGGTLVSNAALAIAARTMPNFVHPHFLWNWLAVILALVVSTACGVVFGRVPATKAAQIEIAEALRTE